MRDLVNLEDNLVPVSRAYKEAFRGMGKSTLILGGIYCTYHFMRGFFEELKKMR